MSDKYGIDEYGRYVVIDDERYAVERYPFFRLRDPFYCAWMHVRSRMGIAQWHLGIIRQHGFLTWNELRQM